jgi:hypothetical protein
MEIYFNPYPGAAKTEEEGLRLAIGTADALLRLKKECISISLALSLKVSEAEGLLPSNFVIFRKANTELFSIRDIMQKRKTAKSEHDKLLLLLIFFSGGKIIDGDKLFNFNDWIVSNINAPAPALGLAAKNKAIALTIPTEAEWRVDLLGFKDRTDILHNLWGQENISAIVTHCQASIESNQERFKIKFNADYCPNALNSAPAFEIWEGIGFFKTMERAKSRDYKVDKIHVRILEGVEKTKHGTLLELKPEGYRIFFVRRKGDSPEILIGGFYKKGIGNDSKAQNIAAQNAKKCIDNY